MTDSSSKDDEIAFLREQLRACSDGITESKYLQQAKKARDLSVKLESEKARVAKLQQALIQHEREQAERQEAEKRGVLLPSAGGRAGGAGNGGTSAAALELAYNAQQVAELRQKLDKSAAQCASLRGQCDKHEREMARVRKVLLAEIGDEAAVEKALASEDVNSSTSGATATTPTGATAAFAVTSGVGHRGRAQQISLLQAKVKELTRKLNESTARSFAGGDLDGTETGISTVAPSQRGPASVAGGSTAAGARGNAGGAVTDFDSVHRSAISNVEGKRHNEVKHMQTQLEEAKEAAAAQKQKADALSSRVHVLERQAAQLRTSLQQVIQKTENDDQLVEAYKTELDTQRAEIRSLMQKQQQTEMLSAARGGGAPASSAAASDATVRLQQQVQVQEAEIQSLRRHIAMSKNISSSGGNSGSGNSAGDDSVLAIVEAQRKTILSLEERLQHAENSNSDKHRASGKGAASVSAIIPADAAQRNALQALRDENASLKERLSAMSGMVEREVALRTAQFTASAASASSSSSSSLPLSSSATPFVRGAALGQQQQQLQQQQQQTQAATAQHQPVPSGPAPTRSSRPVLVMHSSLSGGGASASGRAHVQQQQQQQLPQPQSQQRAEPPVARRIHNDDDDDDDDDDNDSDGGDKNPSAAASNRSRSGMQQHQQQHVMPMSLRGSSPQTDVMM